MPNQNSGASAGNSWSIAAQTFGAIQHGSSGSRSGSLAVSK